MIDPYYSDGEAVLYLGDVYDVLTELETSSVDAVVTSPPYLDMRSEYPSPTSEEWPGILRELRRVCSGTLQLNVGRLWRERQEKMWWVELIEAAQRIGWPLRDTRIWVKPNANPIQGEVMTNAHEYIFMFGDGFDPDSIRTDYSPESIARFKRRFVNNAGVKNYERPDDRSDRIGYSSEDGARAKSYIEQTTGVEKGNKHPAPMPLAVAEAMVLVSGGTTILDPFAGSGTTLIAARKLRRAAIGIELLPEFAKMAAERMRGAPLEQESLLADVLPPG